MSQRATWLLCTLLLSGPGLSRSVRAETEPTALREMRLAAEALADLEPAPAQRLGAVESRAVKVPAGERKAALREAMREAVRAEVAHERVAMAQGAARGLGATKAGNGNDGDNDKSASGQAHSAAAQAQQAKRNNDVSQEHRQNLGKGPPIVPPGQERAPGQPSHPKL